MKINKISIKNFLGIKQFLLDEPALAPILLIAGDNGAGKSSLRDALSLAMLGYTSRVKLKKDASEMINHSVPNANEARIAIETDFADFSTIIQDDISAGKSKQLPFIFEYLIDAERFAKSDDKDRRNVLFSAAGVKMSKTEIIKRLGERGCDMNSVGDLVEDYLLLGFEKACEKAKTEARDNKTLWRGVTGKTYGEKKAETWKVKAGDLDDVRTKVIELEKALYETDGEIALFIDQLARLKFELEIKSNAKKKIDEISNAASLERIKAKLEHDEAELKKLESAFEKAKRATHAIGENDIVCKCPACETELIMTAAKNLIVHGDLRGDEEAAVSLNDLEQSLEVMRKSVLNGKRDLEMVAINKGKINQFQEQIDERNMYTAEMLAALDAKIANHKQIKADTEKEINRMLVIEREFAQAQEKTDKAMEYHNMVKVWSKIAESLEPSGIPSDFINEALQPINEKLAELAELAKWKTVSIDTDINIKLSGRDYHLLSESEKWRCDLLLTIALSIVSGHKFFVVDRLDVLDAASRLQAVLLLNKLALSKQIETAIAMATFKYEALLLMKQHFKQMIYIWMQDGKSELVTILEKPIKEEA